MPSRRLLLSCLLLAACPPRTPPEPPPGDAANGGGDAGSPAEDAQAVPDSDVAPLAPDDPDAPDEPGEVEPGDKPVKPAKPGSTRGDPLADTLSTRASRGSSRKSSATCDGGARRVGETWKIDCNSCSCGDDGQSTCTELACGPEPAR